MITEIIGYANKHELQIVNTDLLHFSLEWVSAEKTEDRTEPVRILLETDGDIKFDLSKMNDVDTNEIFEAAENYSEEDKKKIFECTQKMAMAWQEMSAVTIKYKQLETKEETSYEDDEMR